MYPILKSLLAFKNAFLGRSLNQNMSKMCYFKKNCKILDNSIPPRPRMTPQKQQIFNLKKTGIGEYLGSLWFSLYV